MRIPSDITAVTAALHAYSTGTRWEACAWLLSHTRNWDSVACTTAISSCEKARRWEVALGFFATAVAQGIRRDAAMYNATIACSSQGGLGWIGVLRLVHEMTRESILTAEPVSFASLVFYLSCSIKCLSVNRL